jgi:alpha-L-fucosidase
MLPRLLVLLLSAAAAAEAASQFRARQRRRMPATTSTSEQRLSSSGLPLPTPEQLAWQKGEIMALIHFNMATFFQVSLEATEGWDAVPRPLPGDVLSRPSLPHHSLSHLLPPHQNGDPGCTPQNWVGDNGSGNPNSFAPTNLNISQWADLMLDLGINEAVMTAKHGCGFLLWPTNVTLPNGQGPYTYHVNSTYGNLFSDFAQTMQANGIGHGAYFSLTNNFYANALDHQVQPGPLLPGQVNVTQDQFLDLCVDLLTELWCGPTANGNFTEIW